MVDKSRIMSNDRRMTTDRFYGGVSNRLHNLRAMLEFVRNTQPSRSELNSWVISNTKAGSEDAVSHHLTFLASIELIELSETECKLATYGNQWLNDENLETLYNALSSGVKGFNTILQALTEGEMTDEDIMELLVGEFDEAEMTKPGPAKRHREWLQVLGLLEREDGINRITKSGQKNTIYDEKPPKGVKFTAKIRRIASGNGIVNFSNGNVNIGPVKSDSVDKEITAKMVGSKYAVCETDDVQGKDYQKYEEMVHSSYYSEPNIIKSENNKNTRQNYYTRNNKSLSSSIPKITISPDSSPIEFCDKCGSMMKSDGNKWACNSCGHSKKTNIQNNPKSSKEEESSSSVENAVESNNDNSPSTDDINTIQIQGNTEDTPKIKDEYKSKTLDIDKLRKKAKEDAVDEVKQTTTAKTSTKSQYNRSTKVKDYVKARADATCEGCSEPAPFTSKTGEPYLHAHHVHELSNGGSDTPDTVIALCPNCHYRVHHGEDGDEYNQELLEIVQKKESKQS